MTAQSVTARLLALEDEARAACEIDRKAIPEQLIRWADELAAVREACEALARDLNFTAGVFDHVEDKQSSDLMTAYAARLAGAPEDSDG